MRTLGKALLVLAFAFVLGTATAWGLAVADFGQGSTVAGYIVMAMVIVTALRVSGKKARAKRESQDQDVQ